MTEQPTVLIVDDEPDAREMVSYTLYRMLGWRSIVAADARDALAKVEEQGCVELALLDVMMPHMSGMELFDLLKVRCPGVRGIFISAFNDAARMMQAARQGAFYYLSKPLSIRQLLDVVQRAWQDVQEGDLPGVGKG